MKIGDLELFFHLCGVIFVFLGFGTLLLAMVALARASQVEQVRAIMTPLMAGRRVGPEQISAIDVIVVFGVLLIVSTGIAMARANNYVWSSWVEIATASFILLAPVGPFVINLRLHAIAEQAEREADGALPASLRDRIHDPVLTLAMRSSVAVLIGLVFLMTTKPTLMASVVVILSAVVIGAASSLQFRKT
jgi:hypothetical protein